MTSGSPGEQSCHGRSQATFPWVLGGGTLASVLVSLGSLKGICVADSESGSEEKGLSGLACVSRPQWEGEAGANVGLIWDTAVHFSSEDCYAI